MCIQLEGGTIKLTIINHTLNKYDMLFHMYLDLLPLNLVYFVLENNKYFLVRRNDEYKWRVFYLITLGGCTNGVYLSVAPGFKSRLGYVRSVFHLSLCLIMFEVHSDDLAYLVHKSGRKTSTFTYIPAYDQWWGISKSHIIAK